MRSYHCICALALVLATSTAAWSPAAAVGRPVARSKPAVAMQIVSQQLPSVDLATAATPMRRLVEGQQGVLELFLQHFRGHFDNEAQVVSEQAAGLGPREGGGHEHIHCVLTPVVLDDRPEGRHLLASYYFNGQPSAVFRERLYAIDALANDAQFGACVRMRIFKLRDEMQSRLRESALHDVAWCAEADLSDELHVAQADVFWRWLGERFEGQMRTDSLEIVSERSGRRITVRDDVALWADALWVNDRGSDAETGAYVYGNIHNVPYKMQRVPDDHWTITGGAL